VQDYGVKDMPLFEIRDALETLWRFGPSVEVRNSTCPKIEDLVWRNSDELTRESLSPSLVSRF
jgi:hypothetical protein